MSSPLTLSLLFPQNLFFLSLLVDYELLEVKGHFLLFLYSQHPAYKIYSIHIHWMNKGSVSALMWCTTVSLGKSCPCPSDQLQDRSGLITSGKDHNSLHQCWKNIQEGAGLLLSEQQQQLGALFPMEKEAVYGWLLHIWPSQGDEAETGQLCSFHVLHCQLPCCCWHRVQSPWCPILGSLSPGSTETGSESQTPHIIWSQSSVSSGSYFKGRAYHYLGEYRLPDISLPSLRAVSVGNNSHEMSLLRKITKVAFRQRCLWELGQH